MPDYESEFAQKQAMVGQGGYGEIRRQTMREELVQGIKYHDQQAAIKTELLKLLDENPAIEKFMDLSRSI